MHTKYLLLFALTIALTGAARSQPLSLQPEAHAAAGDPASDHAAIEQVIADFHAAVTSHDGGRILALSVQEGSTWFNVLSDEDFAASRARNPAAQKVRHSSFADFAKFVTSNRAALNAQHTHVQIQTDGTIASVYFDYVFLIDGKAENHGCETWQLVKASDGWKIAAITYSSTRAA